MNKPRSVKLIKKNDRTVRRRKARVKTTISNRLSSTVRSWVAESQKRDRTESLPAFESLFKDPLPEPGGVK